MMRGKMEGNKNSHAKSNSERTMATCHGTCEGQWTLKAQHKEIGYSFIHIHCLRLRCAFSVTQHSECKYNG